MKTKKNTRVATWVALIMGFAAATSVEAATTAYKYAPGNTDANISSFQMFGEGQYGFVMMFSTMLSHGIADFDAGPQNSVWWTRGNDIGENAIGNAVRISHRVNGSMVGGAVAGTNNYGLFETNENSGQPFQRYVVQMNLSATNAEPVAWAQSDLSSFNIAAGKAAIDALPGSGGGTSAVPEASTSLGLLGLAAGGLLTRRRTSRKA